MIGPFSLKRWNSFSLSGVLGEALSSKTTRLLPQQSHLLSSLCLSKLYESCHLASAVSTGPTDHCNIFERLEKFKAFSYSILFITKLKVKSQ